MSSYSSKNSIIAYIVEIRPFNDSTVTYVIDCFFLAQQP